MLRARLRPSGSRRAAAAASPPSPLAATTTTSSTSRRGRRRAAAPPPSAMAAPEPTPPPPPPATTAIAPPAIPRREVPLLVPPASASAPPSQPAATELRVLTWNVLADGLAQHGGWTHLPDPAAPALAWSARFPRLLAEVAASGADLVCLQECNRFGDAWLPAMRALGYDGVAWQKPRSPCERYGADRDGLALFWRAARLRPAAGGGGSGGEEGGGGAAAPPSSSSPAFYSGPYRHLAPSPAALATLEEDDTTAGEAGGNPPAASASASAAGTGGGGGALPPPSPPPMQLEAASQGLIVAVFEDAEPEDAGRPPRRLVVAVTHLKAKEGFEARRREQAAQLCERVHGAVAGATAAATEPPPTAVLVAGDFNAGPESAAAELVRAPASEGGLGLRCLWDVPLAAASAAAGGEDAGSGGGGGGGNGRRKPAAAPTSEELLFTTWKFRGDDAAGGAREKLETIDHIFFGGAADLQQPPQQQPLVPLSRWASPSRSEIGCAALPCDSYPSDHIAVLCRFAWRR